MSQDAGAAAPTRQRLSTPQTLHMMRLEVENALKHGYPISCMMFGLDGWFSSDLMLKRKVIMPLLFRELKAVVFERQIRGLGIWTEGFELAVFPHVAPEDLYEAAEELRERAHAIVHEEIPESEDITISIGIAHNLHPGKVTFETVVEEAETGMKIASSSGGDQVSRWREVETEVDRLRVELQEQLKEIDEIQSRVFADSAAEEELWGRQMVNKVIDLFQREPDQSTGVVRLQKETVALLRQELESFKRTSSASQLIESQNQIQQLERRLEKMTESLTRTEKELKRVASMKDVDMGVASLYRTVQGLTSEDDQYEAKAEMLKNIFDANLALREAMSGSEG